MRIRENSESIAFYGGEQNEKRVLLDRFRLAIDNLSELVRSRRTCHPTIRRLSPTHHQRTMLIWVCDDDDAFCCCSIRGISGVKRGKTKRGMREVQGC